MMRSIKALAALALLAVPNVAEAQLSSSTIAVLHIP